MGPQHNHLQLIRDFKNNTKDTIYTTHRNNAHHSSTKFVVMITVIDTERRNLGETLILLRTAGTGW